jgi:hypothetical protein
MAVENVYPATAYVHTEATPVPHELQYEQFVAQFAVPFQTPLVHP